MKADGRNQPSIAAGTWVELERVILEPGERAPGIPADTASVPVAAPCSIRRWPEGWELRWED